MKKFAYISFLLLLLAACAPSGGNRSGDVWQPLPPAGEALRMVAVDTMAVTNPFVLYRNAEDAYYMVGDGGYLWRSEDMRLWQGPYNVLKPAKESWMGEAPLISSPEIHPCNGRYYYVAAFTNGVEDDRQALCEIFVSDSILGPYTRLAKDAALLQNDKIAGSPTFCTDYYGAAYMLYNGDASRTAGEAIKIIRLGDSLDVQVGEPFELLKAVNCPWNAGDEGEKPIIGSPFMFATLRGNLGMLFTAKCKGESVLGVAYAEEGHGISGPWMIEPEPLLCGAGEAMLFRDYDGTAVMVMHKDTIVNGDERQVPQFVKTDLQYDKLKLKGHYKF